MSTFTQRLTSSINESKYKQYEIAHKINMDVTRLSRIKNGQYNPTPYEIARLAKILDVSSDYLLGLTNVKVPMDSTTEKESELLQTFREMDEQKQNYVLESTSILSKYQDDKKSK